MSVRFHVPRRRLDPSQSGPPVWAVPQEPTAPESASRIESLLGAAFVPKDIRRALRADRQKESYVMGRQRPGDRQSGSPDGCYYYVKLTLTTKKSRFGIIFTGSGKIGRYGRTPASHVRVHHDPGPSEEPGSHLPLADSRFSDLYGVTAGGSGPDPSCDLRASTLTRPARLRATSRNTAAAGEARIPHDNRASVVPALAEIAIQRDLSQKRNPQLLAGLPPATLAEDRRLVVAGRANERAHVFHDPQDRHLHVPEHHQHPAGNRHGHILRRRHDDHAGHGQTSEQRVN